MRIATFNCQMLRNVESLLQYPSDNYIDTICLRDPAFDVVEVRRFRNQAKTWGYEYVVNQPPRAERSGIVFNGLLIFSRVRVEELAFKGMPNTIIVAQVARPGAKPIMLCDVHLCAADCVEEKYRHVRAMLARIAESSCDALLIGDWNTTVDQAPIAGLIARHEVTYHDTEACPQGLTEKQVRIKDATLITHSHVIRWM